MPAREPEEAALTRLVAERLQSEDWVAVAVGIGAAVPAIVADINAVIAESGSDDLVVVVLRRYDA